MKKLTATIAATLILGSLAACGVEAQVKSEAPAPKTPKSSAPKAPKAEEPKSTKLTEAALVKCLDSNLVTEAFITNSWGSASIEIVTTINEAGVENFTKWEADQKRGDLLMRQAKRCITADGPVYVEFQHADGGILVNDNF